MINSAKMDFNSVFKSLKNVLALYEQNLKVTSNTATSYNLYAGYSEKYKRDIYFGGVEIKKNYVSFHLMPVYVNPKLLKGISPELKKRMQGKSCFNFKKIDETLFNELSDLTKLGVEFYMKNGML
jgi:hypothetical protein